MNRLVANPKLRNFFGQLSPDILTRLENVLAAPRAHWDDAHSIIIREDCGMGKSTLWQWVLEVDPTFPRVGKRTDSKGNVLEDWKRYPDQVLIARALKAAGNAPPRHRS